MPVLTTSSYTDVGLYRPLLRCIVMLVAAARRVLNQSCYCVLTHISYRIVSSTAAMGCHFNYPISLCAKASMMQDCQIHGYG